MQSKSTGDIKNRITYVVMIIREFAETYNLTVRQAYNYLRRHMALDFIYKCYEAEHTLSIKDAVTDLTIVSQRHGGRP